MSTDDKKQRFIKFGEKILNQHIELVPIGDVLDAAIDELDNTDPTKVVSFGYDFLDDKLTGLFPGELMVLGGESGTGKTTFATNIMYNSARAGRKVGIFALEDRLTDYGAKALYFELGKLRKKDGKHNYPWNDYKLNKIEDPKYKTYRATARGNLDNENIFFEKIKKLMDIDLLEKALREQTEMGFELFLIDHLHRFDFSQKGRDSKADYIEFLMTQMKQYQNETGARIILVVHYRKLDGQKPTMDSFKDSIAIVQNANYVINLWRDRSMKDENVSQYETHMFIPKSRNPNGECSFKLLFDPEINDYKFQEVVAGTPLSKELDEKYANF